MIPPTIKRVRQIIATVTRAEPGMRTIFAAVARGQLDELRDLVEAEDRALRAVEADIRREHAATAQTSIAGTR